MRPDRIFGFVTRCSRNFAVLGAKVIKAWISSYSRRCPDLNGLHQCLQARTCSSRSLCLLPRNKLPVATASTCSNGCLHLCCACLPNRRPLCATPTSDASHPHNPTSCHGFEWVSSVALRNQTCPHPSIHPSIRSSTKRARR